MRVKSKSITSARTKMRRTKKVARNRNSIAAGNVVTLGQRKYALPQAKLRKLMKTLEPHLITDPVSFDEFFGKGNLPEWCSYLKGLRYREDMTQEEFAEAIGVSQSNLSAMENGNRPIGKELAKRIGDKFGTDYRLFL